MPPSVVSYTWVHLVLGKEGFFGKFFRELDNFVDDATSRRLGNVSYVISKQHIFFTYLPPRVLVVAGRVLLREAKEWLLRR